MVIAVGSLNRVKLNAVRISLNRLYPDLTVKGVDVPSGVPTQPWGDEQIIQGAMNRATAALEKVEGADWGIGLESGIARNRFGYFTTAWCAICDLTGQVSLGGGFNVELPPQVVQDIEAGLDLGQAMSKVPTRYSHSTVGAIGVLTDTLLDRQSAYESVVLCALARYIRPDLYPPRDSCE